MRYYTSTTGEMVLQSGIAPSDTTITVDTTAGLPGSYPYTLFLDYGTPSEEIVDVTAAAGTTLTVTRGRDGTVAQSHAFGAKIRHGMSARDLRESREHEAATAAHGVGTVVGTTETQTLDNKTFTPAADNTAATFRARAGNTEPLIEIQDSSGGSAGTITEGGVSSLFGGTTMLSLLFGGAVNFYKNILSVRIGDDIHGIVGNVVSGATGRFLRLMNGATELFYVSATGALKAMGATFDGNVTATGSVTATGAVSGGSVSTAGAVTAGSVTAPTVTASTSISSPTITALQTADTTNATNITNLENSVAAITPGTGASDALILFGTTTHTLSGVSWGSKSVSFPQAFADVPVVCASVEFSSGPKVCGVYGVSTTGFTVGVGDRDTVSISGTYTIQWIAIGKRV